ncbi:MAG: M18 family aminopeptidase [Ruminococcaceae bacterium]|nr:M18 family aminopeptidase [Oscillospiraceae bacterium]
MSDMKAFQNFLDTSVSAYHATANLQGMLEAAGYERLFEHESWSLERGNKYYLIRGGTTLIAFRVPTVKPYGFMMSACHTDRPTFKLKENCELRGIYTRLATEGYGGMIISSWMDRPLSIAGRVMVETENGVEGRLINIDQDLLLMPNVAIHMNRSVNDGYKWNLAVDTVPMLGGADDADKFWPLVKKTAGGKILGHDLYLYVRQKSSVWGIDGEFISGPALDDLACAWGTIQGFLNARDNEAVPVFCAFDDEEVGSNSPQGAASTILEFTLERICDALDLDIHMMLAQSFLVSADNAHALHPSHPELADAANAPVMGRGVVLKFNAAQRYTTDGVSASVFRHICGKAGVPLQRYTNRPDIKGGSTLGHISLTHVSVPTADIGLPQVAMHSCYETAAVADLEHLEVAMTEFFGSALKVSRDGGAEIL